MKTDKIVNLDPKNCRKSEKISEKACNKGVNRQWGIRCESINFFTVEHVVLDDEEDVEQHLGKEYGRKKCKINILKLDQVRI